MLSLKTDTTLELVAGIGGVPLAELIEFRSGDYLVEAATVRELVDSAATADHRYTPNNAKRAARKLDTQAMYERWRRVYRSLRKQRPNMSDVWYSQQIARQNVGAGRNVASTAMAGHWLNSSSLTSTAAPFPAPIRASSSISERRSSRRLAACRRTAIK